MDNNKFTIILLHYNQEKYIYNALSTILKQDYSNIELLITDDNSKTFNEKKIIDYIEKHKKNNLINYSFIINKENIGTVKTLNEAIKKSSGEYIMFFAADDELYDNQVITKFVNAFSKSNSEIISAQCGMFDEKIKEKLYDFVTEKNKIMINNSSPKKLFNTMAEGCLLAAGATSYRKSLFKMFTFDEKYKLIEDWPFYLTCARKKVKIRYFDFNALKHRNGGVSHSYSNNMSPTVKQYYKDVFNIYENEIIPYINNFSLKTKLKVISDYKYYKNNYSTKDHVYKKKNLTYKMVDMLSIIMTLLRNYIYYCINLNGFIELVYELVILMFIKKMIDNEFLLKLIFLVFIFPKIIAFLIYKIKKMLNHSKYLYNKMKKKIKYGNSHFEKTKENMRL